MVYVIILVLVATAAITKLWLGQRRQRATLESVEGFRESLERIATGPGLGYARATRRTGPRGPRTLDPERREAARRRLEARRAGRR